MWFYVLHRIYNFLSFFLYFLNTEILNDFQKKLYNFSFSYISENHIWSDKSPLTWWGEERDWQLAHRTISDRHHHICPRCTLPSSQARHARRCDGGGWAGQQWPKTQPNVAILQPGVRPRCGDAACTAAVSGMDLWNTTWGQKQNTGYSKILKLLLL